MLLPTLFSPCWVRVCSIMCGIWGPLFEDIFSFCNLRPISLEIALWDIHLDPVLCVPGVAKKPDLKTHPC